MKYWIDTEYVAHPFTLDLVSVGVVAEDGRTFYAESAQVDWSKASLWTLEHVRPQLEGRGEPLETISYGLMDFTHGDGQPTFWGYFPAWDWIALVGLFGGLESLPFHYPQLCLDIKQWAIELGDPELPPQTTRPHHALNDARWTKDAWTFLAGLHPEGGHRRVHGGKHPGRGGRPGPGAVGGQTAGGANG